VNHFVRATHGIPDPARDLVNLESRQSQLENMPFERGQRGQDLSQSQYFVIRRNAHPLRDRVAFIPLPVPPVRDAEVRYGPLQIPLRISDPEL